MRESRSTRQAMIGFTLTELVTAMAIAGVLAAMAVPSLGAFLQSRRVSTKATALSIDLTYARTEAVKRRANVGVCRTANIATADPTCGGASKDWTGGWLVYLDENADANYSIDDDELLRHGRPALNGLAVTANDTGDFRVTFRPDGTTDSGGSMVSFRLCNELGGDQAARVDLYGHGRTRIVKGSTGSPISC